jgi:DNA-binding NarL/FixJ family response regulator
MANIYVVDAHPLMRLAIRHVVETEGAHTIVGEASSLAQLLRDPLPGGVQLVVIDRLPAPAAASLQAALPDALVLLFGDPGDDPAPFAVDRSADGDTLRQALAAALGGSVAAPAVRAAPHHRLSPRELEIFRMILAGMRPKEIAFTFSVSSKTISTHRVRIMRKLGVEGDTGLTRYALAHGLIDVSAGWTNREKSYMEVRAKSYSE